VSRAPKVARKPGPSIAVPKTAYRYLSVEFRDQLRRKAHEYLFAADRVRRTGGQRFAKDIVGEPLFVAVAYLRRRAWLKSRVQPADGELLPYDPVHASGVCRYVLEAISRDDPEAIDDLAKLMKLQVHGGARVLPTYIPWLYYTSVSALDFLDRGQLPTRQEVRNGAIRQRVAEELLMAPARPAKGSVLSQSGLVSAKFEDVKSHKQPRNWRRIFRVLDLQELIPGKPRKSAPKIIEHS